MAAVGGGQAAPPPKADMAPVLQQLNLASLRTRTQDLHNAISRILHAFTTQPSLKWSEVLGQFAMVNVELLNLVEDIKPILKVFVVYPKNVNAENSTILPIMLSSKLLPEMEAEEAIMKEQILSGISSLPVHAQNEKIQRQIETVRVVCDAAEKVLQEARKVYGLSTRQGPVSLTTLDKAQAARIAEQEKLIRAASNFGDGLRIPPDQQQMASVLPSHIASALGTDGGLGLRGSLSALPPSGLIRSTVPQQLTNPHLSRANPLQNIVGTGNLPGVASAATPSQFVNSPRSSTGNFNAPSPQQQQLQQIQQQQQQQQQQHQQQQAVIMQRQQQKFQQLQKQQLQAQVQQNQQLRQPGTPPIPQGQATVQQQGQVSQQHLLQHHQQPKLQQNQFQQLQQQQQQLHYQALQQLQAQQQQSLQQQSLHQQLQSSQLQSPQQNTLLQANQGRSQLNQLGTMSPLYGNPQSSLLPSGLMASMNQGGQSQAAMMQQQYLQGNQSQRNLSTQMLSDPSMYNIGNIGMAGTGAQASSTLALPLQQQLAGQATYSGIFNANQGTSFGQQRQQPPP
ncbi:hypothetical protein CY35_01G003700 [Sphagnum magellanicum]|nr:hypothetical protein CY35_01G003700 [Sphagnum magellanicum]